MNRLIRARVVQDLRSASAPSIDSGTQDLIDLAWHGINLCRTGMWKEGLPNLLFSVNKFGAKAHRRLPSYTLESARAPANSPPIAPGPPTLAWSYLGYGIASLEGKQSEGLALCQRALRAEPSEPENYLNLARTHLLAEQRRLAIEALDRGLEIDPDHQQLLRVRGGLGWRKRVPLPVQLMRNADAALYRAKRERSNSLQVFDPSMKEWAQFRRGLEQDLRGAFNRDELCLHFQPQVALTDGQVIGVEVLTRWEHPRKGTIAPETFIPLAEECGLIPSLGAWVIAQACRQNAEWQRAGLPPVPISVNVSLRQIQAGNLVPVVTRALEVSGLAPEWLRLEINEKDAASQMERVVQYLAELGKAGVRFMMDDFGTGYSSLSNLLRYPLSSLKIDGSLVAGVPGHSDSAASSTRPSFSPKN